MSDLIQGDALTILRDRFADESVQCVVTSPPYWGLRDYGTAEWERGDDECDHVAGPAVSDSSTLGGGKQPDVSMPFRGDCRKCGAIRIDAQLGLEATPELYVANMVEVFREVRRVLKSDGTLWINLGDSYNAMQGKGWRPDVSSGQRIMPAIGTEKRPRPEGLKPKNLVGIPWRVAFALQADGWYLRSDIIWAKPNPMPESVTDRPTKAHEYLFLMSKCERYYYDAEAIKEPDSGQQHHRNILNGAPSLEPSGGLRSPHGSAWGTPEMNGAGRNKRTVWTIATQPYAEAHFATFPPKLIEPCVLAGCPVGGLVLDPFAGSGTTLAVAQQLGRRGVGIELNAEYIALAEARTAQQGMAL